MVRPRCPGQDQRYWRPEDIFDVTCPYCEVGIEFWRDEPLRLCPACGQGVRNPRLNLGCAAWCKHARECLGEAAPLHAAAAPVIERLRAALASALTADPAALAAAEATHRLADTLLVAEGGDPCVAKAAALLVGCLRGGGARRVRRRGAGAGRTGPGGGRRR